MRRVADSRWSGGGWLMRDANGWEQVDGELIAWLPLPLDAATNEVL